MRMQENRSRRAQLVRFSMMGLVSGALLACGGSSPTPDPVAGANTVVPQVEQAPVVVETGPTPAELEAMRLADAASRFEEAAALYAGSADGARDLAAIESLLREALAQDPELVDAWFNIGVVRTEASDVAGARTAYEEALRLDPSYARAMANLGYLEMAAGDLDAAYATFQRCIATRETEPGCNINLALMYRMGFGEQGDVSGAAIERLRFALGGDARNAEAYAMMAQVYDEMGRPELARLVCENAILQGIEAAVLHNRLGLIALQLGDVNVAYQEFQRAVALDPGFLDAHTNIGAMALSFRDHESALRSFQIVLAERPEDVDVRLSYGVALRGMDQLAEAEAVYNEVLAASPNHLGALYNLGVLKQEGLADYPAACAMYRAFLQAPGASASPKHADASLRLTNLHGLLRSLVQFGEATQEEADACSP
jgi:tetratricopeptide (TPR) repeat protein